MWLLYAEAFGAMLILILIVWWTMFHGRRKGERSRAGQAQVVPARVEQTCGQATSAWASAAESEQPQARPSESS